MGDFGSATFMSHDCTLQFLKSTQYKKLAPNALRFTYQNSKSCKPHEKQNKKHQNAKSIDEKLKTTRDCCSLFHFFHVVCKIVNSKM